MCPRYWLEFFLDKGTEVFILWSFPKGSCIALFTYILTCGVMGYAQKAWSPVDMRSWTPLRPGIGNLHLHQTAGIPSCVLDNWILSKLLPNIPSYSGVVILLLLGNCGEEASQKTRSLGHCLSVWKLEHLLWGLWGVTLRGSRGPGDMREGLLSHVGGDYHHWVSLGFKNSTQLETRLSVHSPLPHTHLF